jgi:hypothetical protein
MPMPYFPVLTAAVAFVAFFSPQRSFVFQGGLHSDFYGIEGMYSALRSSTRSGTSENICHW